MKHIAFTGTRNGMTPAQRDRFLHLLVELIRTHGRKQVILHHGDCRGADADAHALAQSAGVKIEIHPPIIEKDRAFCGGEYLLRRHDPLTYLARNRVMVDTCEGLIGTPPTAEPQNHGGSWYTIKYGWKNKKPVVVIRPDGSTEGSFESLTL